MSVQPNKYITPTLFSALNRQVAYIQAAVHFGDNVQAWRDTQELISLLGDEGFTKELAPSMIHIRKKIQDIKNRRGYTIADTINKKQQIRTYLDDAIPPLLEKLHKALNDFGYWERLLRPRASQRQPLGVQLEE